jgi:RNA polymerase sigma factor (sigma-70 family)
MTSRSGESGTWPRNSSVVVTSASEMDDVGRARLEAMYREVGPDLWRAIFAYSGGLRDVTDDVVAESFARAAPRIGTIRNMSAWLYKTCFRLAAAELRRRRAQTLDVQLDVGDAGGNEGVSEVLLMARCLTPRQRAALVLCGIFGYTAREAGHRAGMSEVAVRVHLHAARRRLRSELGGENGE